MTDCIVVNLQLVSQVYHPFVAHAIDVQEFKVSEARTVRVYHYGQLSVGCYIVASAETIVNC